MADIDTDTVETCPFFGCKEPAGDPDRKIEANVPGTGLVEITGICDVHWRAMQIGVVDHVSLHPGTTPVAWVERRD